MTKNIKKSRVTMRPRGRPISEIERDWAHLLYRRGNSLEDINKLTGINIASLSKMCNDGEWREDTTPQFSIRELLDNAKELLFRLQISHLKGEEEDRSRVIYDESKLANQIQSLEELITTVETRDAILALENHMKWMSDKNYTDPYEAAQAHYDELAASL